MVRYRESHALTGDMDSLLHVMVRDLEHFSAFLLDRLLNAAGVADVNSSFVLRTIKADTGIRCRPAECVAAWCGLPGAWWSRTAASGRRCR